jgi:hypothetical protein
MTAVDGKADTVLRLDVYTRIDFDTLERPRHIFFITPRKSAVVFAQMAAKAPFFIDVDMFHNLFSRVFYT